MILVVMFMRCQRVLISDQSIELFVEGILEIHNIQEKREAINAIAIAERNLKGSDYESTLTNRSFRDFEYREDQKRIELRERILNELFSLPRLDNDEDICLNCGGAAPKTRVQNGRKMFYLVGAPASGKSGIANGLSDLFGAYILDSDYAKRKLPEYRNQPSGASLVHEESDMIVFSNPNGNLLGKCIENGYNIIVPKIGHSIDKVLSFTSRMRELGYTTYLISVDLDRCKTIQRAYHRFIQTKRYVPLATVFDLYGNEPTLNYFKIKQRNKEAFDGYAQFSTDVEIGSKPNLIEQVGIPELRTGSFWQDISNSFA